MRILVVDDDDDVREVLDVILSAEGHEVEQAADGIDALQRLTAGNLPSLVLLDMMMPRLDGEGVLRAMKSHPALADVPVVIVSGHHAARQKAAELGAAGCLVKPVELAQLSSLLAGFSTQPAAPF